MADFRRRAATSPAEYGRNLVEAEVHADMVLRRSLSSLGLDCDVSDATLAVSTSRRNLDGHGSRVDSESSFIHSLWVPSPLSSSPVLGRRFGPQPEDRESPASLTPPPPQDAMGPRPPTAMRSSLSPPPPPPAAMRLRPRLPDQRRPRAYAHPLSGPSYVSHAHMAAAPPPPRGPPPPQQGHCVQLLGGPPPRGPPQPPPPPGRPPSPWSTVPSMRTPMPLTPHLGFATGYASYVSVVSYGPPPPPPPVALSYSYAVHT